MRHFGHLTRWACRNPLFVAALPSMSVQWSLLMGFMAVPSGGAVAVANRQAGIRGCPGRVTAYAVLPPGRGGASGGTGEVPRMMLVAMLTTAARSERFPGTTSVVLSLASLPN